jgi:hypothetical protein
MVLSKTKKSVTTGNTTFFIPVFEHGLISVELITKVSRWQCLGQESWERGTRHTWAPGRGLYNSHLNFGMPRTNLGIVTLPQVKADSGWSAALLELAGAHMYLVGWNVVVPRVW